MLSTVSWLHGSPSWIAVGEWVLPAEEFGGRSRTHPGGYGESELTWYRPDRVYVFDSGGIDPRQHLGHFAFTRLDYYLYEVEPVDLGPDDDAFALNMRSASVRLFVGGGVGSVRICTGSMGRSIVA